jgi:hypothetical protein
MAKMFEYRAGRVDIRRTDDGPMILARTDKGQVVIYITHHQLQTLARQTKLLQSDDSERPDRLWDKDEN